MRAVSVHQPWAWAILHAGKFVENRSWRALYRGPLLIHAAASRVSFDRVAPTFRRRFGVELPPWEDLPTRAVLGVVDLVDCRPFDECKGYAWAEPAGWCWIFANARPLAEPIAMPGRQLIWHVADDLLPRSLRA